MTTQADQQPAIERRRSARQKSFLRGMVYLNNRRQVLDCLVRDISPYGARLIFPTAVTTPDTLELHIPQKDETHRVRIIWRNGQEMGVAFAQPATDAAPASDQPQLAERVARLELEIVALKRALKKLKADGSEFDAA